MGYNKNHRILLLTIIIHEKIAFINAFRLLVRHWQRHYVRSPVP